MNRIVDLRWMFRVCDSGLSVCLKDAPGVATPTNVKENTVTRAEVIERHAAAERHGLAGHARAGKLSNNYLSSHRNNADPE
jgi:hypothetical protein